MKIYLNSSTIKVEIKHKLIMKKVFTAASIVAISLLTSCGGAEENKSSSVEEAPSEIYEETLKAQDEIDDIKVEIEEMEEAEADLEDLENELDNI